MKPTTVPAGDLRPGMTVKVRGRGRKNRTTIWITNVTSAPLLDQVRIWGINMNASYGQSSSVCRIADRDEQCELIEEAGR